MLENIKILDRFDEVAKTSGQMSMFLEEMYSTLDELEHEEGITTEDSFALCTWDYVLEEIYTKYIDLVHENVLFNTIGLCHVLRKRSPIDGIFKEAYYE